MTKFELMATVPTYTERTPEDPREDFGPPYAQVIVREEAGLRLLLRPEGVSLTDGTYPDLVIERRLGGWFIPVAGCTGLDPNCYLCILDDGRVVVVPEHPGPDGPPVALVDDFPPELDQPLPADG